ncbi:MAG: hypothetical protein Kow0092_02170 [Deferrisomatales bacterium]
MNGSWAAALRAGQAGALAAVGRCVLQLRPDNLVERPWGGRRLLAYKGLPDDLEPGKRFGEAFEVSAAPSDPESRAHPSVVRFPDGSEMPLPDLLKVAGRQVLGEGVREAFGGEFPLLPKTLDIRELLSVQAHPEGHAEVYVVLEAAPGATIRLGFRRDADPEALRRLFLDALARQEALQTRLPPDTGDGEVQAILSAYFTRWDAPEEQVLARLRPLLRPGRAPGDLARQLTELKRAFWAVLDLLHEIPVEPGQVIYNATPARLRGERLPSAEVHALGNPEGRELLLLEIRRPGPTYRAWDHVRFPVREIHLDAALRALNLRGTRPEEFRVPVAPVPGRPGLYRSVRHPLFSVEHLRPGPGTGPVEQPGGRLRSLHVIRGEVVVRGPSGEILATLGRGQSALVPPGVSCYAVEEVGPGAEVVQVTVGGAEPNGWAGDRNTR